MNIKKVGITGAAGNIGSTLIAGLSDSYQLSLYDIQKGDSIQIVDLAEPTKLQGKFNGLDALIHLSGDPSPSAPTDSTLRNNFKSTSYVFQEAYLAGVSKIIFASSNFYHEGAISDALQEGGKIKLSDLPTPISMYGKSKVFGENLGLHFSNLGVQFVALRIGWTVPGDDPRPYAGKYMAAMFCSKRDLVLGFERALKIDTDFMSAFVISDNQEKVFDMQETNKLLGFYPQDSYESFF